MITELTVLQSDDELVNGIDGALFADSNAVDASVHEVFWIGVGQPNPTTGERVIRVELKPKAGASDDVVRVDLDLSDDQLLEIVSATELGDPTALDPSVYEVFYVQVNAPNASGDRSLHVEVKPKA